MDTQHIVANTGDNPLSCWNAGGLIVVPTETVYGLAADAENSDAVAKIFALKQRPRFNPLIVHVGSVEIARKYAVWNDAAEKLAAAFWPGPLAIILPVKPNSEVSDLVTCGGNTIALRMPNQPHTLRLLNAFGRGVAAPSANRSGRVSPTSPTHVQEEFGADCPPIIDGGACPIGVESTVVDVSDGHACILRAGAITKEMIISLLSELSNVIDSDILRAPGQLKSHYAPAIPVRLNANAVAADEALLAFGAAPLTGAKTTINLSERGDVNEAAANLFHALRTLDTPAHTAIVVMPIPHEGIGEAINDRLTRAAADRNI